jgi:glutamate-ammonia-ligase adenylyltransferase
VEAFERVGLANPDAMRGVLERLPGEEPPPNTRAFMEVLIPALAECPDPDRALVNLSDFIQARQDRLSLGSDLIGSPDLRSDLLRVLSHSQVFANVLVSHPELLDVIRMVRTHIPSRAELLESARESYHAMPTRRSKLNALRRLRKRELLRIGTGDLLDRLEFHQVVEGISDLAEVCLQCCLELGVEELRPSLGVPRDEAGSEVPFAVIGFGKLGGRELNYSSDVDIMFVCGSQGTTDGPRSVPALDYFDRLSKHILSFMSEPMEEGMLFRADARLRPEGKAGPLVRTLEGCRIYYDSYGRAWERQALIKTRPVAGDPELGRAFVETTRPFVYARRLDAEDLAELRRLKLQQETRCRERGEWERDLKQGGGGIRDIEYIVQILQLGAGERLPDVRTPRTLEAIERLEEHGAFTRPEARDLRGAYVLLRQAEHAVQIRDEQQRHTLPADGGEMDILAKRLGYRGTGDFEESLAEARQRVREIYEGVVHGPGWGGETRLSPLQQHVLGLAEDNAAAKAELERVGFADPEAALVTLDRMSRAASSLGDPPKRELSAIVDDMVQWAAGSGDPHAALAGLDSLTGLSGSRRRFFELLRESPQIGELLSLLAGRSRFLTRWLERHPELIDSLLDPTRLTEPKEVEDFADDVRGIDWDAGLSSACAQLRRLRRREMLRVGLRDVAELSELHQTASELTALAEAILAAGVKAAAEEHMGGTSGLAVLGLGSLGGRELHFSSDLDVAFGFDPEGVSAAPEDVSVAMRSLIRSFAEADPEGNLFEVDARLRPEGQSSPLVPAIGGFRRYFEERGQAWERVAATRARPVAGDPMTCRKLLEIYRDFAYRAPLSAEERAELDHIRGRIEGERDRGKGESLDLKLARGGLIDLEFALRIVQIDAGTNIRSVRVPGLREAIRFLARARAIPPALSERLSKAWRLLRGLEMRLQVVHEEPSGVLEMSQDSLATMGRKIHSSISPVPLTAEELGERLEESMSLVRDVYERVVESGRAGLR